MFGSKLIRRASLVRASAAGIALAFLLLALSGAAVASQVEDAGNTQTAPAVHGLPLDHFKCYQTDAAPPVPPAVVLLQDQFDGPNNFQQVTVGPALRFCNPVTKFHAGAVAPISYPDGHLKLYRIGSPVFPSPPTYHVVVENQFGLQRLRVYGPAEVLAVPTAKNATVIPRLLDHFKCYRARGVSVSALVDLEDQFHLEKDVKVMRPFGFCNPTVKIHPAGTVTPILHPDEHLVCYTITQQPFTATVLTLNQFGQETLPLRDADVLCVPSKKLKWK